MMYVPKHSHWVGPVILIMVGFYVRQQFGAYWDVFVLVQFPLVILAVEWGTYIWQAGVLYQRYVTGAPLPEVKHERVLENWNTGEKIAFEPLQPNYTQIVEMPKFDLERRFAIDVLRMYDMDPGTQKFVDLTEERWVLQKKMFSQKPFANMKRKWEHFGVIRRKSERKNSKFLIVKREAVALIASGNSLPEMPPTPPE